MFVRSLLHDIESISAVDGYEEWRQKESQELTNLLQDRFKYLQNPEDCDSARKLVCTLNKVVFLLQLICCLLFNCLDLPVVYSTTKLLIKKPPFSNLKPSMSLVLTVTKIAKKSHSLGLT